MNLILEDDNYVASKPHIFQNLLPHENNLHVYPAWLAASLMSRAWFSVSSWGGTPRDQDRVVWWWKGLSLGKQESWVWAPPPFWVLGRSYHLQGSILQNINPLTRSAGCLDHTGLGLSASYLLFLVIHHAHGLIFHVIFNLAPSYLPFRSLILEYTVSLWYTPWL